jgi:hypothetical protein
MTPENVRQKKLDEIVGRASRDKEFRTELFENPKAVLEREGLKPEEVYAIVAGLVVNPVLSSSNKTCYEHG